MNGVYRHPEGTHFNHHPVSFFWVVESPLFRRRRLSDTVFLVSRLLHFLLTRLGERVNGVSSKTRRTLRFCEKMNHEEQTKRAYFPRLVAEVKFRFRLLFSHKWGFGLGSIASGFHDQRRNGHSDLLGSKVRGVWRD